MHPGTLHYITLQNLSRKLQGPLWQNTETVRKLCPVKNVEINVLQFRQNVSKDVTEKEDSSRSENSCGK